MVVDILYGDVLRTDGKYYSSEELIRVKKFFDDRPANFGCHEINRTHYETRIAHITHIVNNVFIEDNILKADIEMIKSIKLHEFETFMFVDEYFPEINIINKSFDPYKLHKLNYLRNKKLNNII